MSMGKSIDELVDEAIALINEGMGPLEAVRKVTEGYSDPVRTAVRREVID